VVNQGWQPPQACTVIGAAHRRQGTPCQDASLSTSLPARGDARLQLMVVADGHGSSRYWLSHVGSTLACTCSHDAVAEALRHTPLTAPDRWREQLERELPAAIHRRWLTAIEADWQGRPEAAEQPFSPLSYGCTLGLVLLAPQWWGCTGLGDWDLVGVETDGNALLLSEERSALASGEATASLCQSQACHLFRERAQLQELIGAVPLRALVLSTDGVRKSCATDADFLRLCAQVIELTSRTELEQGLAQITAEGSGDDVSLALAIRAQGRSNRPTRRRTARLAAGVGLLLAAAIAGSRWLLRPPPQPPLAAGPPEPIALAVADQSRQLCTRPEAIGATLRQRHGDFERLSSDPQQATALLAAAARDPLGALIAASQRQRLSGCAELEQALKLQWQLARSNGSRQAANKKAP
jgi:hypothetical protein